MTALAHTAVACQHSIVTDGVDGNVAGPLRNSFCAWLINPHRAGQVAPIKGNGAILADFADSAATNCSHKDTFLVLETDAITAGKWLHTYQVKRRTKPRYVRVGNTTRAVHDLYAEHVMTVAVSAFEPVEQWSWTPGADTVGRDASLVEVRS